MVKKVSPIPKGYRTATPSLIVSNIEHALDFYAQAFDATLLTQSNDAANNVALQATIKIGNSIIILQQESIEYGLLSPLTLGNSSSHLHLYIEDIDALWSKALSAGALAISDPVNTYWGDRTAILSDVFGHRWSLASRVEHVSKQDVQKRHAALYEIKAPVELAAMTDLPEQDIAMVSEAWLDAPEVDAVRH